MGIEDGALLWEEMDMNALMVDFQKLYPEYTFDGKAVMNLLVQGKLWDALKELGNGITGVIYSQTGEIKALFFIILVLGIVAALFINFADLFQDHQVSDLAFYFVYMLMIVVLLKSFESGMGVVREILQSVTTFMRLYIPTYMVAVGSASGAASASVYYQVLLFMVYLIEWGLSDDSAAGGIQLCLVDDYQRRVDGGKAESPSRTAGEGNRGQYKDNNWNYYGIQYIAGDDIPCY